MIKIHVISDLFYGFNEFSDPIDETIPDVDLVIINGNIGHIKRGMFYAEKLCLKYPDIQFVYNLGETERYYMAAVKITNEIELGLNIRKTSNSSWPKNLHWSQDPMIINLKDFNSVDVLCTYGFPKIHQYEGSWEDTNWYKNYVSEMVETIDPTSYKHKPKDTSNVNHGTLPMWASVDWINEQHEKEYQKVKKWELEPTVTKILVTHINPYNDQRLINQTVSPYKIHLYNQYWIASNTKVENIKMLGSRLYSNPGRGIVARSRILTIN